MDEKIIEVKHLAKKFGSFDAVKDVSFTVYKGDVFGFLGPKGPEKVLLFGVCFRLLNQMLGTFNCLVKHLVRIGVKF
jgi:ABC-2 type transport system ATP-binding protein